MATAGPLKSSLWSIRLTVIVAAAAALVVLMSALGARSIIALSDRAAGFNHHLTKPVDPSDLETLINAVPLIR
jgi:hypothetical protein